MLDALAVKLDGKPASPQHFSRRRRVLHRALGYAVRKKRLDKNPLSKPNLPEGWIPPQAADDTVDLRAVGSPALVAEMLRACGTIGKRLHVLRADASLRGRRAHPAGLLPAGERVGAT
jgi:hypothetical protein